MCARDLRRSGIDRRTFVIGGSAAAAVAAAGIAWLRSGKSLVADVELLLDSAPPERIAAAFAEAVLPLEDSRFPRLDPAAVTARAFDDFHLSGDERFAQALRLFDVIAAFGAPPASVGKTEAELYGPPDLDETAQATWFTQRQSIDATRFEPWSAALNPRPVSFTQLSLNQRRTYVELWCTSALGLRRRIYKTLRAVNFSVAYSDPSVWRAIGYEGPFVAPTPR